MISFIVGIIGGLFTLYTFMIFGYIFLSWVPQLKATPLGDLLERLVGPYLQLFRRWIPPLGMIDLSPIVALFVIYFAKKGLIYSIQWLFIWT